MKRVALIALAALAAACSPTKPAETAKAVPPAAESAVKLVDAGGVLVFDDKMFRNIAELQVGKLRESEKLSDIEAADLAQRTEAELKARLPQLKAKIAAFLGESFTPDELAALAEFFASPAAQAMNQKMPKVLDATYRSTEELAGEAGKAALEKMNAEKGGAQATTQTGAKKP